MPSRAAHLIAFLSIVAISVGAHLYIFRQLARMIRRDFPKQQKRLLGVAKVFFVYFDLPFIYIFFWKHLTFDTATLTTFLHFPFAAWQMLMLVWAVILVPIGLYRSKVVMAFRRRSNKLLLKPITRRVRRSLGGRRQVQLEPTEEIA